MRRIAKRLFYASLRASGASALFGLLNRGSVPILFYHGVTERPRQGIFNCEDNHLGADVFEAQLRYLKAHRRVIPLRDYARALRERRPVDPRAAVITFDDGFENNFTTAFPLLKKYGLPASVFVVADFVTSGKPLWVDRLACAYAAAEAVPEAEKIPTYLRVKSELKKLPDAERVLRLEKLVGELTQGREPAPPPLLAPLKKEQLREMAASGLVEIGSHSMSHAILPRLDAAGKRRELSESRRVLGELCAGEIESFAYPNGGCDAESMALTREAGYSCALAAGMRLSAPTDDLYAIARLALGPGDGDSVAAATLSGLRGALLALRSA